MAAAADAAADEVFEPAVRTAPVALRAEPAIGALAACTGRADATLPVPLLIPPVRGVALSAGVPVGLRPETVNEGVPEAAAFAAPAPAFRATVATALARAFGCGRGLGGGGGLNANSAS